MSFLVISASLNPVSRSRLLARASLACFERLGVEADLLDLRATPLPFCDGNACYADPLVQETARRIANAEGIVMAVPIYNFDVNAAAKNLVELTGEAWEEKVTGFLCAAGGRTSYMSIMGLANALMLDFRTIVAPRFVFAHEADFSEGRIVDATILQRIEEVTATVVRFARALNMQPHESEP
ncbi:MAG: NAD(P)H-dependent oxidoreductase [Candidatus Hydrogenedentes bacterium]|nr:NAD(P)H-dependent oxidoreductase [Candidatus Hydrogenedentota bacterium]